MDVRNLFVFCLHFRNDILVCKEVLKRKLSLDVGTVLLTWIFLISQNVVQSTKDVYGVNLSDIPSEDDLAIYARWEKFLVVIGKE